MPRHLVRKPSCCCVDPSTLVLSDQSSCFFPRKNRLEQVRERLLPFPHGCKINHARFKNPLVIVRDLWTAQDNEYFRAQSLQLRSDPQGSIDVPKVAGKANNRGLAFDDLRDNPLIGSIIADLGWQNLKLKMVMQTTTSCEQDQIPSRQWDISENGRGTCWWNRQLNKQHLGVACVS